MTSTQGMHTVCDQHVECARPPYDTRNNKNGAERFNKSGQKIEQKAIYRPESAGGASGHKNECQQD